MTQSFRSQAAGLFPGLRAASAVLAVGALVLPGCTLFTKPVEVKPPEPVVVPEPVGEPPVATHRFEIDIEHDDVVGVMQTTVATAEDTLPDIARRFNLGYEEIVRANPGVDPWLPGKDRLIVLPTRFVLPNAPREGLVINIPAMRLFYYPARKATEPAVVYTYPIGIGKVGWVTPQGSTKVIARRKDPTWTVPASVRKEHLENGDPLPAVVGPGPDNPLGRHAFTLGWPSYLVHGTNKPYGVGMRSSHGCIRLYPEDIEQLFDAVPIGTKLRVVDQPFLFGLDGDDLLLQAYGALEDDKRDWRKNSRKLMEQSMSARLKRALKERPLTIDWERVVTLEASPRGIPVSVIAPQASIETVVAAALKVRNTLPEGSNWNGLVEVDQTKFNELISESEPHHTEAAPKDGVPP